MLLRRTEASFDPTFSHQNVYTGDRSDHETNRTNKMDVRRPRFGPAMKALETM